MPYPLDDPKRTNTSQVHRGFLHYYQSLEKIIRAAVQEMVQQYPSYKIWSTGHSLGGAAATIAVISLRDIAKPPINLVTFGCPRVGNYDMTEYFQTLTSCSIRVTHNKDIVPHLPPCSYVSMKCSRDANHPYQTPQEVYYKEDFSSYRLCNAEDGEDPKCSDTYRFPDSIEDHRYYFGIDVGGDCVAPTKSPRNGLIATE